MYIGTPKIIIEKPTKTLAYLIESNLSENIQCKFLLFNIISKNRYTSFRF